MDIIFIEGLKVNTTIGYYEWEKQIKQLLVFDVEIASDVRPAAENDELAKTIDYAVVSEFIDSFCQLNPVDLLETLGQRLVDALQSQYAIDWIRIKIAKPGAVEQASSVGIIIERGKRG
ncbi:dihydroneopterin aldolase [Thalassotalea mangrovi]|uniref:7,8-dihydroneopterin aldolase n=1 Tax=Thalassotalea mangrovi TaxID=2572245 RepID=A0A4U1B9C2_9GAMM|nr:dihydroneopterin aldolase [Thalassotalea mangrovi]TKB47175.1 dihydroneopterin aldolase [Thalassotalea mangrovi]